MEKTYKVKYKQYYTVYETVESKVTINIDSENEEDIEEEIFDQICSGGTYDETIIEAHDDNFDITNQFDYILIN